MKTKLKKISFQNLHQQALLLTPSKKEVLIKDLSASYSVFSKHDHVDACPHCASTHIVKNGTRSGFHKYICRGCKKNFTFRSKSSLRGIHKLNAWNLFLEDFMNLNITPVRVLKEKLGVSEQTIFNWRHKLLATLISLDAKYTGEALEFDELVFLISRKGRQEMGISEFKNRYKQWRKSQMTESKHQVKVFATYGRDSGLLDLYKSGMGRTSKTDMGEYFFAKNKFKDITVYSDKHPTYKGFFRDNKIPHETFLSAKEYVSRSNVAVHNQTVNGYAKSFKDFVNTHLKGVSTKYMDSYLKWFQYLQATKVQLNNRLDTDAKIRFDIRENLRRQIVHDQNGLEIYRKFEFNFTAYLRRNGRSNYGVCKHHYYNTTMADVGKQILLPPPSDN